MLQRLALVSILLVVLVSPSAAGQRGASPPTAPQDPVRDRVPASRAPATAVIRGRVIDGATGQAIARARVRLQRPQVQPQAGVSRSALTNAEGMFEFGQVPAGPINMTVEKSTYQASSYPDPGRTLRSGMSARRTIASGQVVDDLVIRLYRGASISGRVIDAHGDPVESAQVAVMRIGGGPNRQVSGVSSNDLGEFRVGKLQPGSYLLYAANRPGGFGPEPELLPGGEPMPQPLPTYYPGVLAPDQAQLFTLERGQSIQGLDLVMHEGTPVLVSGIVVRSDGTPVSSGFINSRSAAREMGGMFGGGTSVRPDGTFRMTLPPGQYILTANVNTPGSGGQNPRSEQSGMVRLTLGGSPAETVTITTGSGAVATGRVVFEGGAPPAKPPAQMNVPFSMPDSGGCRSAQVQVADDWTFKVDGLLGTCAAPASLVFGRWTLKSVQHRGEELLHRTITFEPGQQWSNVQLTFTDKRSELSFRVTDNRGQATREFIVLAFPADKERWTSWATFMRTYIPPSDDMLAEAKASGRELPPNRESLVLAPGEYYVIALDDVEREEYTMPTFLDRLIPSAMRLTVAEGVNQEVDLRRVDREEVIR
jgi:hypothetical protein